MGISFLTTQAPVRSEPAEVHRDTAMPPQTAAGSPQKQKTLKYILKLYQEDICNVSPCTVSAFTLQKYQILK